MIRKGDRITYTGRLSLLFDRTLLFRLEDVNIEIINDKTVDKLKSKLEEDAALSLQSIQVSEIAANPESRESSEGENILPFEGLDKIFGKSSGISESGKEELWNYYRGKYIRWQGIVNYKGLSRNDYNRVGIRHKAGTNVELRFDEDRKDMVKMIKREDNITYTGKLAKLFGRNLLCSIEDVNIKKIGDKIIAEVDETTPVISDSVSNTDNAIESEVIEEPDITMAESMAPKVIEKEITGALDGFVKLPFEELDEIFGRENKMTESQKDTLWEEHKNKYVRWTGEVMSRGKGKVSGLMMGIKHKKALM